MPEVTMAQALNTALKDSLAEDDRVLVLGEDVGKLGGVFRITQGLQAEFGEERVFDTPLAESGIAGVSVGLALAGWKPVAEMQFDAFSYPALDQVISHVARYRHRSRGSATIPMVIRIPSAGGIGAAENHSDSPDVLYAAVPGLKVVMPSNPLDAYTMLRQAIADPDPVVFLEPKSRYWMKADGDLKETGMPLGRARIVREGDGATLIAWGAMVTRCLEVADIAAADGVELEVVDLRSLAPLDLETIAVAVRQTGRAVIVHEAPMTMGPGAEVSARIMEDCFEWLEAPVTRVTGYDTPYPPATIEHHYVPSVDRILRAVERVLTY
ncbi:MAG TPA: alpha-ketoacid dehydrogenase subunit beta [Actinomycetota bacterium]|nr:alpha-ketoacid dehydrogenase subunit beta [Actinomycetota bacterium]